MSDEEKVNILVVDDQPANLLALQAMLDELGQNLHMARSGEEALRYLLENEAAVILLDVQMPGMDGYETAALIRARERSRSTPIIFLTALQRSEAHLVRGYALGAVDYMFKPLTPEVLKAKVAVFVDLARKSELVRRQAELLRARNAELARSKERAERESRFKSKFLASMSHELRTPLNAIIGFTQIMLDDKAEPVTELHKEYLEDILTSSQHLLQLINDVLDLSKIESGRIDICNETVDLDGLVSDVASILRRAALDKQIELGVHIDPRLGSVTTDPAKLKQVLYNYLSNALKFTPQHGHIGVRIVPDEPEHMRIEVEDSGIGIAPEDLDRLFLEFEQLNRKHPGTGLGLAVTKRVVESQGGRVGVRSTPGVGSVFFAVLPCSGNGHRGATTTVRARDPAQLRI